MLLQDKLKSRYNVLHLFITEVYLLHREVTNLHPTGAYKDTIIRLTSEISLSLNAINIPSRLSYHLSHSAQKLETYLPSFLPIGSSYSIPTQCPAANLVGPENLTVPRLSSPASVDTTWHREPTGISTIAVVVSRSLTSIFGANRPTLFFCLYARTVPWYTISSIKGSLQTQR